MDFLGEINFVKSHEESTKASPISIEEFKAYWHMSEIFGKYTGMSISQIFEAYSKYSRDLQGSFGENIELAITNFFRFDVSVITSISVCEARSVYLNTLNTSEHSEAHKQHARLFTGYFPSSISKLSKVIREKSQSAKLLPLICPTPPLPPKSIFGNVQAAHCFGSVTNSRQVKFMQCEKFVSMTSSPEKETPDMFIAGKLTHRRL